ncbi:DUF3993 domain-containing protein [Metabacillus arenae]|uniref:DUF3993 domain-containing protein n=1 Tax=Metabacillus arenae TaxID=2771434 RepID=A0A926NBM9_9BACI|nr:DUF3993 domain-containing protein [Metabacillus arenae]MBD1381277.1 DUF3993 domain-containing protein [Metabacillus arenae]
MKKLVGILVMSMISFVVVFQGSAASVKASGEELNRDEAFSFLQKAFDAQVSLTGEERSYSEMESVLSPYFTTEMSEKYLKENAVKEGDQWIVYGSDFTPYTIPFYDYNQQTKVISNEKEAVVFQFYPASTEGPVGYEDHYAAVKLQKKNGNWKITEINEQKEKPVIEKREMKKDETKVKGVSTIDVLGSDGNGQVNDNSKSPQPSFLATLTFPDYLTALMSFQSYQAIDSSLGDKVLLAE